MTAVMIAGQQFTQLDAASRRKLIQKLAGHSQHSPREKMEMKGIIETHEVTQKTYCRAETDRS